jgi:hypothetical protein
LFETPVFASEVPPPRRRLCLGSSFPPSHKKHCLAGLHPSLACRFIAASCSSSAPAAGTLTHLKPVLGPPTLPSLRSLKFLGIAHSLESRASPRLVLWNELLAVSRPPNRTTGVPAQVSRANLSCRAAASAPEKRIKAIIVPSSPSDRVLPIRRFLPSTTQRSSSVARRKCHCHIGFVFASAPIAVFAPPPLPPLLSSPLLPLRQNTPNRNIRISLVTYFDFDSFFLLSPRSPSTNCTCFWL